MKIVLPENQSEISLGQYQRYEALRVNAKESGESLDYDTENAAIEVFTGIDKEDAGRIKKSDRDDIILTINKAINKKVEFKHRFSLDMFEGVEFGLIPNFNNDKITGDEYTDFVKYGAHDWSTMHRLMAILFRPISEEDNKGNYRIQPYNGTGEYAEAMREMPLSIVNSAIGFFLNLREELNARILLYSAQEQQREVQQ